MPNLPTIAIDDPAIWNRLMTAFGGDAVAYRRWLKRQLIEEVRRTEMIAAGNQTTVDLEAGVPAP